MTFLPYACPDVSEADIARVNAVLRSGFLTTGPVVPQLEEKIVRLVGARYAVCCSSGTSALHLATLALGLGEGAAAVVPSVTFLATANAVRLTGAEVVFADVDPQTGLMTADTFSTALDRHNGPPVTAVLPVHLTGQCCDMDAIHAVAAERGLAIIEDACHAFGGRTSAGTVGDCKRSDMTMFSLHPTKLVAGGEGGVVTTNDPALADRMRLLRNHGMTRDSECFANAPMAFDDDKKTNAWYYEMSVVGMNYRLSDIHAALALSQLESIDAIIAHRAARVAEYDTRLVQLAPRIRPVARTPDQTPAWHLYSTSWDFSALGTTRNQVMRRLHERGVGTQVHYIPVHLQPYYRARYGRMSLPGAEQFYAGQLSLPLHTKMASRDVGRVVDAIGSLI